MDGRKATSELDGATRRQLAARGNRLRAGLVVGRSGLSEAVIAQVRHMLAGCELIKIRVEVDRGEAAEEVGEKLAQDVPCHFVKRVGKVILLYRPQTGVTEEKRVDKAG